jgi:hypothetical protein
MKESLLQRPRKVVTCVLVLSPGEANTEAFDIEYVVERALDECASSWSKGGDPPHFEIHTIAVDEALSTWSHWQKAVDMLSQAQIAFVDISSYRAGVMFEVHRECRRAVCVS